MSLQVTATQGGVTANGLLLRVTALTGAAALASQSGATASRCSSAGPAAALIGTTEAGSVVYGAILRNSAAAAFTAAAGTELDDNVQDAANTMLLGTCKTSSPTGTPGDETVGSAGPSGIIRFPVYSTALAEILPSGTLAEDSSSPGPALTEDATTVTTDSFTPPSGALLVARIASNGGAGFTSMTVTGGGLTWTPLAEAHSVTYRYAGVWAAQA